MPSADARAPLVILSACESGVYQMGGGDFPIGGAPELLRSGVQHCIGSRFKLDARFAAGFFPALARELANGSTVGAAMADVSSRQLSGGADLWRHLGCVPTFRRT